MVISFLPPLLCNFCSPLSSPPASKRRKTASDPPSDSNPPSAHTDFLPVASFPYAGNFSGVSWNGQALLAVDGGKQHAKMRKAIYLAMDHDFAAVIDTHSNVGKVKAVRTPKGLRAFWSHGTNFQAGVGLLIKDEFLSKFNPVRPEDWKEIEPGRSAMLQLRGPLGCIDIVCMYWSTREGSKARRIISRNKVALRISRKDQVMTVLTGDFNYVPDRVDRICGNTGSFTGGGDQDDEEHFHEILGIPHGLAEWHQEHFTHCQTLAAGKSTTRSRNDRMYCNQHVASQLDREYGCSALTADKLLSTHRPISFRRSGKNDSPEWSPPLPMGPLSHPHWGERIRLKYEEKKKNDDQSDNAFRRLLS